MRKLLIIAFSGCLVSCSAQISPQSKKITENFFPEVEMEINTPAFQKKKGFTDYDELITFLTELQNNHPSEVSIEYIGNSQKGKAIPLVKFERQNGVSDKLKLWFQGGLHGDEPASTEGVLYLMDRLLNDAQYSHFLDSFELAFVPMANIDGYEKQDRYAANGLDLNRDQTKLMAQESVVLKQAFSDFGAEVALDFHEYRPYRKDFARLSTYGVTSRYDVMFLYSGNLNVPENLRSYTQDLFVKNAVSVLEENQLTTHDYISSDDHLGDIHFNQGSSSARSSATSYALTNSISSLIEVRGVGIGRTSFKRRVNSTFLVAMSYLETAYEHRDQVKGEIQKAIASEHEAAVKTSKTVSEQTIRVIDIDTEEEITLQVTIRDALQSKPVLTRTRPTAYLILETEKGAIEKLKTLGLTVVQLPEDKLIQLERYSVTAYLQDAQKYEGVHRQTIETAVETEAKMIPKGTYIVYLNQAKANLAIEVLEPEADNSFVSFDVIHTQEGSEIPVYRYLLKEKI